MSRWSRPRTRELTQPLAGLAIVAGLALAVAVVGLIISVVVSAIL